MAELNVDNENDHAPADHAPRQKEDANSTSSAIDSLVAAGSDSASTLNTSWKLGETTGIANRWRILLR